MSRSLVVARRELGATFDSAVAYVQIAGFGVLANALFVNEFFLAGRLDLDAYFRVLPLLLAVFLPAASMRLWAEERKHRTVEFLLTLPIRSGTAVLGKFLASLALLGVLLATALPLVVMLVVLGDPDLARVASGFVGAFLGGAFLLALGGLCSALTRDQVVAFVLATVASLFLVLTGREEVVGVLDGLAPDLGVGTFLLERVSILPHLERFAAGRPGLDGVLYFVLGSAVLLWATGRFLDDDRD
ncbi:MAG: ABC transporter permease [Planctomycetota bacterium]